MKQRIEKLKEKLKNAAVCCGRDPKDIKLVAVSKTMSAEKVETAINSGATILGENYIQESREKIKTLSRYDVQWHFIGHLQSNKAKYAVPLFDLIHSVDSLKLAKEINKQAKKIDKIQDILIQINISRELSKSGIDAKGVTDLVRDISLLENVSIKGLMGMPPYYNEPEKVKPYFAEMRKIRDEIKKKNFSGVSMDELSMGMTGDFEAAIEEGSTFVRIGTAIFGARN